MPPLIRFEGLATEMAERLSDRFMRADGQPIDVAGRTVQMMFELPPLTRETLIKLEFEDPSPARAQGLRIKVRNGKAVIAESVEDDLVLWSDSAPRVVEVLARPDTNGKPMTIRVWNVWRDAFDVMQAWTGDAGMVVEDEGDVLTLRCSDGFEEPTFDDLVVRMTVTEAH